MTRSGLNVDQAIVSKRMGYHPALRANRELTKYQPNHEKDNAKRSWEDVVNEEPLLGYI